MVVPPPHFPGESAAPARPIGKAELRKRLRGARAAHVDALGPAGRALGEAAMAEAVLAHLGTPSLVAGYIAIGAEPIVTGLLEALAARGIGTALASVESRAAPLHFLRWRPGDTLVEGPFGLLQPQASALPAVPDLILTPLVGFDRAGGRLGQGAGHYDRAFATLPDARRIGIGWSVQEQPRLALDPWDMPLHAVATEREWIEVPR